MIPENAKSTEDAKSSEGSKSSEGAISVYFAMVTSVLLLFNAFLIDYARIAAMELQVRSAAHAGARSVLSAFDDELYQSYGLFARGGTLSDEIFNRVLTDSLAPGESDSFRLLNIQLQSAHVNNAHLLGFYPVYREQILQEMKYKAPIDFTIEIAELFMPLSKAVREAAATVGLLEQLEQLYEQREGQLKQVIQLQRERARLAGQSPLLALLPVGAAGSAAWNVRGAAAAYDTYSGWLAADRALLEQEEPPEHTWQIAGYEQRVLQISRDVVRLTAEERAQVQTMVSAAHAALERARQLNEQIRDVVERARLEDSRQDSNESGDARGDSLREIREMTDSLVMAASVFDEFEKAIAEQARDEAAFQLAANESAALLGGLIGGRGDAYAVQAAIQRAIASADHHLNGYTRRYLQPGTVLEQQEQALQSASDLERRRQETKAEAEGTWQDARHMLKRVEALVPNEEQRAQFHQLAELTAFNLKINANANANANVDANANGNALLPDGKEQRASEGAKQALSAADGFLSGVGDLALQVRDAFYLNEYTIQRFAAFDPQMLHALFTGDEAPPVSHMFFADRQQVEYILYGQPDPVANIALAMGEIFAFRVALRTMEGFIESRSLGHPLLILAAAVLYGLKQAIQDMLHLVQSGTTPLSKYVPAVVSYADYLRLFLVLHGGGERKLSRMIAVTELATGYRLTELPVAVTGEVHASMPLWFLPGMVKLFGDVGWLRGKVKGKRYETKYSMGWSYG